MHVTLDWTQAVPLGYEEALQRAIEEFASNDPVDVGVWRGGDLEVGFSGVLLGVDAYDDADPPTIVLEFSTGAVVLSREAFEGAEWLVQEGPITTARALRWSMGEREVEITNF
jgi:hypothetical protein